MSRHPVGGDLDGPDDVRVAGAAAEIAGDGLADLALVGTGAASQQLARRHDDARGAVPALQSVLLPERLLQRMQAVLGVGEPLDRRDLAPVRLRREDRARLDAPAVE